MTAAIEPLTEAWHEARRAGIGSSEIAAVLGISPWESPFSLWWRKREGWQVDESDEMRTGTILEPAIANWAEGVIDPNENLAFPNGKLIAHPQRPWQLATPDRVVHDACGDCDGRGFGGANSHLPEGYGGCASCLATGLGSPPYAVLECKWTGSWDGWGEPETDEIPVHYRAQVQWQCDVLDVDSWYLAALGPSGFRLYLGRRDRRDQAVMVEHGTRFMRRLEAGDPPPVDGHTATINTLRRLHPDLDDVAIEVPDRVAANYLRAVEIERKAKQVKAKYEAELRAHMGSARKAVTSDGRKVATHVIADIAERTQTVAAHRRDYLLAPRTSRKAEHA